ncbi:hypothetical protein AgCh_038042 [Apium graveolens]
MKDRRYVGIWYYNSSEIIVWVANRDVPIPSNVSGTFGIDIKRGNLEVSDSSNTGTYFSTYVENRPQSQNYSRTVKLHDNGNLVLTNDITGETLWESFKHPTDTFLPGMKMDESLILTSWRSTQDPATGNFWFQLDKDMEGGYVIKKYGIFPYWKSGGESNDSFIPRQMSVSVSSLLANSTDNIIKTRLFMQFDGEIKYLSWEFVQMRWSVIWSEPNGPCSVFRTCKSSKCNPDPHNPDMRLCSCLPGFEPTDKKEWKSGNFANGCKKKSNECTTANASFVELKVKMVSNTLDFKKVGKDECRSICQEECTCQAYSYSSNKMQYGNSGCWLWLDNLDDIQEGSDSDRVLFIRDVAGNRKRKMISSTSRGVIIATSVIFAVALLCSITCISYRRAVAKGKGRNIKDNQATSSHGSEYLMDQDDQFGEDDKKDIDVPFYDLESILAATDNFSQAHKLGQGGFGPVYKGKFLDGTEIAVKRLSSNSGQGLEEFKNEVVLIAKLQHRNLVRLLGYCIKGNEKILLYECMPNKSLDAFLFDEKLRMLLTWATRFDIIVGVARGLLYLHQDSRLRIIHRDMKASNILLDDEMNPKISDFGLARIVGRRDTESNTTRVMGTYGYMAPEYALEGQFSVKSDAFSFGVVVLEIITGKKITAFFDSQLALSLLGYAWNLWKEEKPMTLLDEMLVGSCNNSEVLKCITVGLLCVQDDPNDRPDMSKVVFMLSGETETLPNPKEPAFVTRKRFYGTASSSSTKPETLSKNEITFSEEDGR